MAVKNRGSLKVASSYFPSVAEMRDALSEQIEEIAEENKQRELLGLKPGQQSEIEEEVVNYVKSLTSAVAETTGLKQFWEQASETIDNLPSEYAGKDALISSVGNPTNFGTFLQRGLFGLHKIISQAGIKERGGETTKQGDIPRVDERGRIIAGKKSIEMKSSIALANQSAYALERVLGVEIGQLTIGELLGPNGILLTNELSEESTRMEAAKQKALEKMYYFLWMRFENPDEPGAGKRIHLSVMILFMRLLIDKFMDLLKQKDVTKPRIEIKADPIVRITEEQRVGDMLLQKQKMTIHIRWGSELKDKTIDNVMRHEIEVLSSLYGEREDFINKFEGKGKTAQAFYAEIMGNFIKKQKFYNLGAT